MDSNSWNGWKIRILYFAGSTEVEKYLFLNPCIRTDITYWKIKKKANKWRFAWFGWGRWTVKWLKHISSRALLATALIGRLSLWAACVLARRTLVFVRHQPKNPAKNGIFIGWRDDGEIQRKSAQIYTMLVSHHEEIMAMREQVQLIRGFLAA